MLTNAVNITKTKASLHAVQSPVTVSEASIKIAKIVMDKVKLLASVKMPVTLFNDFCWVSNAVFVELKLARKSLFTHQAKTTMNA